MPRNVGSCGYDGAPEVLGDVTVNGVASLADRTTQKACSRAADEAAQDFGSAAVEGFKELVFQGINFGNQGTQFGEIFFAGKNEVGPVGKRKLQAENGGKKDDEGLHGEAKNNSWASPVK